mmetsp:Transcript_13930/g.16328  ORF Transcript_13930/g.16328 Transcript_13930/m.16328 type:complete len:985 (+) Transcript_13930:115-3069(+)
MGKKKDKGKKMGLGEFLGDKYADAKSGFLPKAPSMNREEQDRRGGGRYDRENRDGGGGVFGRGGRRFEDEEEPTSAADEASQWRRGGAAGSSQGNGMDPIRGSRANEPRGFGDYGASEEAGPQWRRDPGEAYKIRNAAGARDMEPPLRSEADEASQWRKAPTASQSGPDMSDGSMPRSQADEVDQWRRRSQVDSVNEPPRSLADEASQWRIPANQGDASIDAPRRSLADEADQWRKGPRENAAQNDTQAENTGISQADEANSWRATTDKSSPGNQVHQSDTNSNWRAGANSVASSSDRSSRPNERDNWRKSKHDASEGGNDNTWARGKAQSEVDSDARPRLQLKKKGEAESKTEISEPTKNSTPDDEAATGEKNSKDSELESKKDAEQESEPLSKWEKIEKELRDKRLSSENEASNKSYTSGEQRRRMFGDTDRDRERESVFSSRGKRTSDNPAFAAFGGRDRNSRTPTGTYSNPAFGNGRDRENDNRERSAYSNPAFGGRDRENRRENAYNNPVFGSRERDDERDRRPGGFKNNPVFGSGKDRENNNRVSGFNSNPAFGSSREREDDREPRNSYNNPVFGSSRDRVRESDREGGQRGAYNNPAFGGGSTRDRDRNMSDQVRAVDMGEVKKTFQSQKRVSNWAGSSDSEDEDGRPKLGLKEKTKVMTEEEIYSNVKIILKEYFLMQRPGDTLARVQKTIGDQKYQVEFIKGAIVSCYGETRAEIKAAMLLLQKMRKDSLAEPSHFADGFESVCNKIQKGLAADSAPSKQSKAKENLGTVTKLYEMLSSKSVVDDAAFGECAKSLLNITSSSKEEEKETENIPEVETLLQSSAKGDALTQLVLKVSEERKAEIGVLYMKRLIESKEMCKNDLASTWIDEDNYGSVLAHLIYDEEPDRKQLQAQVDALNVLQSAFHALGFPRVNNKSALEGAFMKMYEHDIVVDEAFKEWISEIGTPGKGEAVTQTSAFVAWTQEEDSDDEDSDEE